MDDKRDAPEGSEGRGNGVRRGAAGVVSGMEFAGIGIQFAATILVFVFAGVWLDNRLGTSPWLLLVFVFVGAAGGFYSMYRRVTAAQRRSKDVVAQGQSDGGTRRGR
jgi:ATP synthase protein I